MTDNKERLVDLLTSRATEGLTPDEAAAIERLLAEQEDFQKDDFERAAAAADLAFQTADADVEPLPAHLKKRILADAAAHLPSPSPEAAGDVTPFRSPKKSPFGIQALGWYAAAAMLVLALWSPWSGPTERPAPPPEPTLVEQREDLRRTAPDVIEVAWATPESEPYTGVRGDVVWSNRRQAGFMRLVGMPANRSESHQYQLWIVDPRDEHPIDGGVFDIPAGATEVVVPIDAKLEVDDPKAFAITLEKAGGVVVSDGPLLVVAPVEA